MQRISPSYAAKVGLAWVVVPGLLLFGLFFWGSILSIENLEIDWGIPDPLVMVIGFVIGFLLASLWWMFTVMPWRLWAFSRVSDPVELHAFATAWFILHEDTEKGFGKVYESIVIASAQQRQRWKELEANIQNSESFLLEERFIYYSPVKLLWWTFLFLAFAGLGVWFIAKSPDDLQEVGIGLAFVIFVLILLFVPTKLNDKFTLQSRIKVLMKKEVQLRISRDGISITKDRIGFISWDEIDYISETTDDDGNVKIYLGLKNNQEPNSIQVDPSLWAVSDKFLLKMIEKAHQHFSNPQTNRPDLG